MRGSSSSGSTSRSTEDPRPAGFGRAVAAADHHPRGDAGVEMIEHVMAALAGLQVDNCGRPDRRRRVPRLRRLESRLRRGARRRRDRRAGPDAPALVVEEPVSIREGDAVLAIHPPGPGGGLTLSYHLDYGRDAPIPPQSYCLGLSPESFREEIAASRTFLLQAEAAALRAAGIGSRTTEADVLLFGRDGVIGNELRFPDECVRHKILDMVGDLALLGTDLHGFVVAYRSGHQTNARPGAPAARGRRRERDGGDGPLPAPRGRHDRHRRDHEAPAPPLSLPAGRPGPRAGARRRVVGIKNVSINEPFFAGHWPGMPIMPGVLVVEALAQTAGVLIAASIPREGKMALIAAIDGIKLRRPIMPGDQVLLEVVGDRIKTRSAVVSGTAKVGGELAAEARIRFAIVEADARPPASPRRGGPGRALGPEPIVRIAPAGRAGPSRIHLDPNRRNQRSWRL